MNGQTSKLDQYVNRAIIGMDMSAANTLTFEQIRFGVGTFQGVALVIHKVDFYPGWTALRGLVAATDAIQMALTTRDTLTTLDVESQDILGVINLVSIGVAVEPHTVPYVLDWSNLPGGGMIVPANPLYMAMSSGGLAAAGALNAIIYYTFKQLADKDYIELIQTLLPGNI